MKTANRKQVIDKVIEGFIKSDQFNSIENGGLKRSIFIGLISKCGYS